MTTEEHTADQEFCELLSGKCVSYWHPERPACSEENCAVLKFKAAAIQRERDRAAEIVSEFADALEGDANEAANSLDPDEQTMSVMMEAISELLPPIIDRIRRGEAK